MLTANRVEPRRGIVWIAAGWNLFFRHPLLWLSLSFVYLVFAMLLELIPFIGWLILVMFTPVFLLSTLSLARAQATDTLPDDALPSRPASKDFKAIALYLRDLVSGAARRLFSGFSDEHRLMPIVILSTLLLGGVAGIGMLSALLKVGHGTVTTIVWSDVGYTVKLTALISLLVVLFCTVLLLMAFLHTVSLTLFGNQHPLPAIESSFSASSRSFAAFALFAGAFLALAEICFLMFYFLSFPFDYLAFLTVGMVALPVLIGALYASYQDLYATPA